MMCESLHCSRIPLILGMVSFLNVRHLNMCLVVSLCGFSLSIPNKNDVEHHFMCLFAIHILSLVKSLFKSFPDF